MMVPEELEIPGAQPHLSHVKIIETSENIYSNQTGHFPVTSSQGCKYIIVLHYYNSNTILWDPLK